MGVTLLYIIVDDFEEFGSRRAEVMVTKLGSCHRLMPTAAQLFHQYLDIDVALGTGANPCPAVFKGEEDKTDAHPFDGQEHVSYLGGDNLRVPGIGRAGGKHHSPWQHLRIAENLGPGADGVKVDAEQVPDQGGSAPLRRR